MPNDILDAEISCSNPCSDNNQNVKKKNQFSPLFFINLGKQHRKAIWYCWARLLILLWDLITPLQTRLDYQFFLHNCFKNYLQLMLRLGRITRKQREREKCCNILYWPRCKLALECSSNFFWHFQISYRVWRIYGKFMKLNWRRWEFQREVWTSNWILVRVQAIVWFAM